MNKTKCINVTNKFYSEGLLYQFYLIYLMKGSILGRLEKELALIGIISFPCPLTLAAMGSF